MNEQLPRISAENKMLTETNEALLKSKARLQQEIIDLRKQIISQAKNEELLEQQSGAIAAHETLLEEREQEINALRVECERLDQQLAELSVKFSDLEFENLRLKKRTWYHQLLGLRK